ncbi:MAG TPA: trehalose-phosphatase [Desulfotomaculum sp.]|nr:trehalose-phosphatase [Desulfotomaculum sp.]
MMGKTPSPLTPDGLAALVRARELLLMLDYDGTLVPMAPLPHLATPSPEILNALQRLAGTPGRVVAVISGRRLEELQVMLPLTGLYLAGTHGAEWRNPGGRIYRRLDPASFKKMMDILEAMAVECVNGKDGFLIENKGLSLALHYRRAEPAAAVETLNKFHRRILPVINKHGLEVLPGRKVVEIRPRGVNKGIMVQYLCRRYPQAFPLYFGDDRTDEDAFAALEGGWGILVSPAPRPSAATFSLSSPREVYRVLLLLNGNGRPGWQ